MGDIGGVLATLVAAATVSVPITSALVAAIKRTCGTRLSARYYPTVAIVCGILSTCALTYLAGADRHAIEMATAAGLISGLIASGMFRSVKREERTDVLLGK
jgi:hypothetical protein